MHILVIDGHPDEGRLVSHLLDRYAGALPPSVTLSRVAIRDLAFDANMRHGYGAPQPWESDLERLAAQIVDCDHLVIGFPLWWGAEPAQLKGLLDRLLLPGFAFRYRRDNPLWDRLLAGRSADVVITMDTPPWYLKLAYGNSVIRRWRRQVLGFVGFDPVRTLAFGPTRRGGAAKGLARWEARIEDAARSASRLKRAKKTGIMPDAAVVAQAIVDRKS